MLGIIALIACLIFVLYRRRHRQTQKPREGSWSREFASTAVGGGSPTPPSFHPTYMAQANGLQRPVSYYRPDLMSIAGYTSDELDTMNDSYEHRGSLAISTGTRSMSFDDTGTNRSTVGYGVDPFSRIHPDGLVSTLSTEGHDSIDSHPNIDNPFNDGPITSHSPRFVEPPYQGSFLEQM